MPFSLREDGPRLLALEHPRQFALTFDDFAGLDAAGADADTLASAGDLSLDGLKVHVPATPGSVVGMRDVVAELRAFAAKITFVRHDLLQSWIAEDSRVSSLSEVSNDAGGKSGAGRVKAPDLYRER